MAKISKKAQVEVTFNWMYVLIAGAVIILFFAGIVVKQKAASEESLTVDVIRIMDSILNAASVTEKTKNIIDISGLSDYTLYFDCQEEVGKMGIKGHSGSQENNIDPVFAPAEIAGEKLFLWSLPYKMPFKVIDMVLVSSEKTKFFLISGSGAPDDFMIEFMNSTKEFNRESLSGKSDYEKIDPEGNFQIRIVDFGSQLVKDGSSVPEKLRKMDDDKVTAVSFPTLNQVNYFRKSGDVWTKLNAKPVQIISLVQEKDAAKYGAIFAADDQSYQCNMMKAFRRMAPIAEIYQEKAKMIAQVYEDQKDSETLCYNLYKTEDISTIALPDLQNGIKACLLSEGQICQGLTLSASELAIKNQELVKNSCVPIY